MSVQDTFFCDSRGQRVALLACPSCRLYPCGALNNAQEEALADSPLLELAVAGLEPRRRKMFLIKYKDGTYKEVEDLDPSQPDLDLLEGMEKVFQVNREWVPHMVLRPKPKAERQKLRQPDAPVESEPSQPQPPAATAPEDRTNPAQPPAAEEPELIQVSFL